MFWFSDKIALKMSKARPLSEEEAPRLHQMVRELAHSAGIPMPRLYLIPASQPNAFATGRSPKHSAVAVTEGITQLLSETELRGVIAHELAHIRNRDTLITTVAAAIGGAITWLGYALLFMGGDDDSPLGLVGALAMVLLAPIAATIIQLAISRQREFSADATGARSRAARTRWPTRWSAWRRGEGDADAGQLGRRAAVHRQAVRRRRHEVALLDPSPDRGAGAPPARAGHLDKIFTFRAQPSYRQHEGGCGGGVERRRRPFFGPRTDPLLYFLKPVGI